MAVKWKWKPAAGGAVSPDLTNRLQAVETKSSTNEANITNLQQNTATKQYVNEKIRTRVLDIQNVQNNTYTIEPVQGYQILSVMVGRKRNSDGFYFFQSNINLNFQVFLHTDGKYKIYTQGPATDFGPHFRIIIVEMKV